MLLIGAIVRAIAPVGRRLAEVPAVAEPSPVQIPAPRKPPQDFAAEGSYGEAVHAMLLLALRQLAERGGIAARDSATSREILADVDLGADGRSHLEDLIAGVERWWFGGRELTREQYERCAAAWAALQPLLEAA